MDILFDYIVHFYKHFIRVIYVNTTFMFTQHIYIILNYYFSHRYDMKNRGCRVFNQCNFHSLTEMLTVDLALNAAT